MSVRLMAAVFESETLGPTERLIMLALADHADDEGRCYPSIARICRRTGLSERAVQTNIGKLVEQGYITINYGGGKGHSNLYSLSATPSIEADKPRTKCTPQEMHPAADAPQTPHLLRSNPAADAPEPSENHHRTISAREQANCEKVLGAVLSPEAARAYVDHRKAKRAKLTEHAAKLIADKLRGHPDPDGVVFLSIQNGWTGVFPDKVTQRAPQADDGKRGRWKKLAGAA